MQTLTLTKNDKAARYEELLPQVQAIITGEKDAIANMGNICAMLREAFGWLWIGFYRVDRATNQLVLGPFQGPLACTRIPHGKGVCGEAWASGTTQVVDDVLSHPNHIACSSLSRSEIVVPIFDTAGMVVAVLDIDASEVATFDALDQQYLEQLVALLGD